MNLFIILYIAILSAAAETQKSFETQPNLTFNKLIKPTDRPVEESTVYHHAPTEWIKISKKK